MTKHDDEYAAAVDEFAEAADNLADQLEDFDAFWTAQDRKGKTTTIMGERVTLPPAIPLQFELEARKLEKSNSDKDIRKLVGILFGKGALERWAEKGMDGDQFAVLLAWAPQVIAGRNVTLAEVAKAIESATEDEGDGPGEA